MTTTKSPDALARRRLFIGGEWVTPAQKGLLEVHNPATEELLAVAPESTAEDVDAAVAAARASFDAGDWSTAPASARAAVMNRAADILESRSDEIAEVITNELGCTLRYARTAHVPSPIRHLRYFAELAELAEAVDYRTDGANRSAVVREPVGVVGAVTPWNGPLSNPMLKTAPALAAGCSIVVKPAPEAPLAAFFLAEALEAAGLPAGVFNLVPGGPDAGRHLVGHPEVDKVAFTGSTATGRAIMAACAPRIARVTLELGGKSAAIILDDADIELAVDRLLPMMTALNGQACVAQTRILVHRRIYPQVVDAVGAAMSALVVGDPFDAKTDVGPLVSAAQRRRVEGYLESGRSDGARVVTGGGRPDGLEAGWFVQPTVFAAVNSDMRISREEIFGPVVGLTPFDRVGDAVDMANDSIYGLSGSVWSADTARAMQVARGMRTGMVSINGNAQAYGSPFGGFKQSGMGREMCPESLHSYMELKSIAVG